MIARAPSQVDVYAIRAWPSRVVGWVKVADRLILRIESLPTTSWSNQSWSGRPFSWFRRHVESLDLSLEWNHHEEIW